MKRIHTVLAALYLGIMLIAAPLSSHAEESTLPDFVHTEIHAPLKLVGEGSYRKLGLKIYHASLWAPNGSWKADQPFVLQLVYARSLSKDTILDAIMDDIKEQNVADDATLARWHDQLSAVLPAVEENDTIVAISAPGKKAKLFFNGKTLSAIEDKTFSTAFFNIWLGDTANESLRKKLLGQGD